MIKPYKISSAVITTTALVMLLLSCKKSASLPPAASNGTDTTVNSIAVPLAGNAYVTHKAAGDNAEISDKGLVDWSHAETVASTYFRVNNAGQLIIALKGLVPSGSSTIAVKIGEATFSVVFNSDKEKTYAVGTLNIAAAGYVKVDVQGAQKRGSEFARISDIIISGSATADGVVFANDPENFYWSRRGPSVHLGYPTPDSTEWFYNEMTVPAGEDKIGSFFMSNGFGEGYFGIQVNSASERRILFSVWEPEGDTTTLAGKGPDVFAGRFGGEGTGGQSYALFNWQAGTTYKFLTQARPDGAGNTIYSAWFYAPEKGAWWFIASWRRPKIATYLKRLHSFLENFIPEQGWQARKVFFQNQWARTTNGKWHELTAAKFTADATARNGQRKDYAGGVENGKFFLKNGGFFAGFVAYDTNFSRTTTSQPPVIDFNKLP